ncbi:MAG: hypothetical protein K6T88_07720 [Bacillus sp. (in: Bacteria)]|nr:hypothetical protein [Bacillus sp. (in: firmicutes)]
MRITKGYGYEDGISYFYPHKLYEYQHDQKTLILTSIFYDREPQLGGRVITFRVTSPRKDVIRITANYHRGYKSDEHGFPVRNYSSNVEVFDDQAHISFFLVTLR